MASLKAQQSTRLIQLNHAWRCRAAAASAPAPAPGAAPCTAEGMQCPYFQFLWGHMERCTESVCSVKHCVSSRFCIEHYKACADARCDVCVPVKRAMLEAHAPSTGGGSGAGDAGGGGATAGSKRPHEVAAGMDGLMAASIAKRPRVDGGGASHSHSSHLSSSSVSSSGGGGVVVGGGVPLLSGQQLEQLGLQLGYPRERWAALSESAKLRVYQEARLKYQQQQQEAAAAAAAAGGGSGSSGPQRTQGGGAHQYPQQQPAPAAKKGKLDGDCCLVATFTPHQILRLMTSLREDFNANETADSIRAHVMPFMNAVQQSEFAWIFNVPVDPVRLNLPDYFDVVRKVRASAGGVMREG
jgi:hypothetical protein